MAKFKCLYSPKAMPGGYWRYEIYAGSRLLWAIEEARGLLQQDHTPIAFDFNDTTLVVSEGVSDETILSYFDDRKSMSLPSSKEGVPMAEQWINRTEVKSQSSNRLYIVSQHATKRHWACSCPGFKTHRKCKHLDQLGLPCHEQPFEPKQAGYLDGYETYEGEPGNPVEARKSFLKTLRNEVEPKASKPKPQSEPVVRMINFDFD